MLAGTNSDKIPGTALSSTLTLPGSINISNDTYHYFSLNGGNPIWFVDNLDSLQYNRATNAWWFAVGGTVIQTLASNGKLTGSAFFDSGEVAIATNATALIAHGLGALPRFIGGGWSGTSGAAKSNPLLTQTVQTAGARSELQIIGIDNTNIQVHNWDSVTRYAQVFAQL